MTPEYSVEIVAFYDPNAGGKTVAAELFPTEADARQWAFTRIEREPRPAKAFIARIGLGREFLGAIANGKPFPA